MVEKLWNNGKNKAYDSDKKTYIGISSRHVEEHFAKGNDFVDSDEVIIFVESWRVSVTLHIHCDSGCGFQLRVLIVVGENDELK